MEPLETELYFTPMFLQGKLIVMSNAPNQPLSHVPAHLHHPLLVKLPPKQLHFILVTKNVHPFPHLILTIILIQIA